MLSKYLLQTTLSNAKKNYDIDSAIVGADGILYANTFEPEGDVLLKASDILDADVTEESSYSFGEVTFYPIISPNGVRRTLVTRSINKEKECIALMEHIQQFADIYEAKDDKDIFLEHLLSSSALDDVMHAECIKYNLRPDIGRGLAVVYMDKSDLEIMYHIFKKVWCVSPDRYMCTIDDALVIVASSETESDFYRIVEIFLYTIEDGYGCAYERLVHGRCSDSADGLIRSYREARVVGKCCELLNIKGKYVSYDELGIELVISELPEDVCNLFLERTISADVFSSLDEELNSTIDCFFENNLNTSETAKKLFIHRNTLIYRLNKILSITGLDIKRFEDAVGLKLARLIYMRLSESKTLGG